jgi:hypothetical protein
MDNIPLASIKSKMVGLMNQAPTKILLKAGLINQVPTKILLKADLTSQVLTGISIIEVGLMIKPLQKYY